MLSIIGLLSRRKTKGDVNMEITQKKRSIKHTFTFEDDNFNFAYNDKTGSGDTDYNYADFPKKSSIQIDQNEWLRNVGILWCLLGVFQFGYAFYEGASLSGQGRWVVLGLACVVWAHFSTIKYSIFKLERGNIFIIQDKNHDQIIEEIRTRRKSQLLSWYGDFDPDNDIENEIGKFNWLVEQGALSKEESEKKIAQAKLMSTDNFVLPGERLN